MKLYLANHQDTKKNNKLPYVYERCKIFELDDIRQEEIR